MQFLVIAEWDLLRHDVSIEALRAWAEGPGGAAYEGLSGMVFKSWYSNPHEHVWGAVYLLTDSNALNAERLPRTVNDRTGPIGMRPDRVRWHVLETTVRGGSFNEVLATAPVTTRCSSIDAGEDA